MLKLAYSLNDLNFSDLMAIYEEDNRKKGDTLYPELTDLGRLRQAEMDFLNYLKYDFFRVNGSFYAVWEAKSGPVCALRLEPYRDGYLLEALETAPEHRGKGYATALIQETMDYAVENDLAPVYSHIRKGNRASEQAHSACGFVIYKDVAAYIDGSVDGKSNTWIYTAIPGSMEKYVLTKKTH